MSSEQDDEFLPDDEMMEELPEDGFLPEEEAETEEVTEETEATDDSETPEFTDETEEASPEFSQEGEDGEEAGEEEEESEKDKPIEYRPPRMDLYTMLLVLSLIFVSLAAAIHWLEVPATEYGNPPFKKNSPVMTAPNNP
ncbi:MAG: hypothetical protein Q4A17_11635 [Thermoguttaceae bacterium]|nr:hypothetical protein [Thermoguttaceae bacterium]MDO4858582.1 hypothetical protein [Thermoguttaceae bacterium]